MKSHAFLNSQNARASQSTHKAIQLRGSAAKHAMHRYERRKMREFLRHGLDEEEASLRLNRFG